MEPSNETLENALFSNIYNPVNTVNNKPAGFDQEAENTKVSRLNASPGTNKKTGPSLVLKVMAGDRVQINTWSFYNTAAQLPSSGTNLATELLSILPGAIIGNSGGKLEATNMSSVGGALSPNLLQFLNGNRPYDNNRPRAYLNWILFDEQFNYVSSNSGVMQVQSGTEKQPLVAPEQLVSKNGYLFVYVSNESPQDVYFDDLTVRHITGPLVEEKSYYPFGLVMGAISSRAVLKAKTAYAYNAGSEWEENGVEYYHTFFRKYDAQIGRFTGVDILSEKYLNYSPYQYSENNPILISDPTGAASDFVNPAQFKDAKSLINYVMENGVNSFEHQFTRWLFFGSLDSSPANGGGGTFSDMQIQFGDIMERGSKKNGQTGFWINVSGFRYDRNEDKDENGNNVITLNTVMVGRVFISDQTLWSTAMEWGETHRDAYFHFMGSVEKFDAMFDKNYSLYRDRLTKGAPLTQSGDRNSYTESLSKLAAHHARYLDGKRFEAVFLGSMAGSALAASASPLIMSAASGLGRGVLSLGGRIGDAYYNFGANTYILLNQSRNTLGTALAMYFGPMTTTHQRLMTWANSTFNPITYEAISALLDYYDTAQGYLPILPKLY
ncbi:MAG TPA: hypothetical protein DHV26_13935 [Cytophagales bacterium]|nr:hypothetical protein [Cytophagales bacterium]